MLLSVFLAAASGAVATTLNTPSQTSLRETTFRSEPSFDIEYFFVVQKTSNLSLLAPGYIFLNPLTRKGSTGPQIYTNDGTLIWYGGTKTGRRQQDFHACDYLENKDIHLCYSEMLSTDNIQNLNPADKVIYDNTYSEVRRYNTSIGQAFPNLHEFNTVQNGQSYLQPVYPYVKMDLRPYGGQADGRTWDACFQENSLATGNPIFEWCWLDYYPEWQTSIFPIVGENLTNITSPKAGEGVADDPFDPAHINSIDKNEEGDYLVSLRHVDQVLKIAGPDNRLDAQPGKTLWRLGGKTNDFTYEMTDVAALFTKQHHARFISTLENETVFSILDNAWEGCTGPSARSSAGKIISINNQTMTARVLHSFVHPQGALTPSQASMSVLPNGNAFIGWGALSDISEFSPDGRVLFHGTFSTDYSGRKLARDHSYRAFKSPWIGKPAANPKLIAYSRTCKTTEQSPLVAWVSWNGDTEALSWRFAISSSAGGPWLDVKTVPRAGFETEAVLLDTSIPSILRHLNLVYAPFVKATALNARGEEIGRATTETFVPGQQIEASCNTHGCFAPTDRFDYAPRKSCGRQCGRSLVPLIIACVFLFLVIEYCDYSYLATMTAYVFPGLNSWTPTIASIEMGASEALSNGSRLAPFEAEFRSGESAAFPSPTTYKTHTQKPNLPKDILTRVDKLHSTNNPYYLIDRSPHSQPPKVNILNAANGQSCAYH